MAFAEVRSVSEDKIRIDKESSTSRPLSRIQARGNRYLPGHVAWRRHPARLTLPWVVRKRQRSVSSAARSPRRSSGACELPYRRLIPRAHGNRIDISNIQQRLRALTRIKVRVERRASAPPCFALQLEGALGKSRAEDPRDRNARASGVSRDGVPRFPCRAALPRRAPAAAPTPTRLRWRSPWLQMRRRAESAPPPRQAMLRGLRRGVSVARRQARSRPASTRYWPNAAAGSFAAAGGDRHSRPPPHANQATFVRANDADTRQPDRQRRTAEYASKIAALRARSPAAN